MAGLIVPPMWAGCSARYRQTPPPSEPQHWWPRPPETPQRQQQRKNPSHHPSDPESITAREEKRLKLFIDLFTASRRPLSCPFGRCRRRSDGHVTIAAADDWLRDYLVKIVTAETENVFSDVCTWRQRSLRGGQRSWRPWRWTVGGGQVSAVLPVVWVLLCWVIEQVCWSMWRLNRSQISLNHCETGRRRVHRSFCSPETWTDRSAPIRATVQGPIRWFCMFYTFRTNHSQLFCRPRYEFCVSVFQVSVYFRAV